jgi:LacI family transcriptional regulator
MRISSRGGRGRVSQADIAARAGVSQAAVSLILRDQAEGIPGATRAKVLAIAAELGYRADPLARRLAAGRSQILGVFTYEKVFPVRHRDFYHPFLLGIEEAAEQHDQDLLLFTSAAVGEGEPRSLFAGGENKLRLVDAAVLLGRDELPAELEQLSIEDYPFVFIGRRFLTDGTEVPNVAPDYEQATADLGRRLAALGHRRVAYVGADPGLPASVDRLRGLAASGMELSTRFTDAPDPGELAGLIDDVTAVVAESAEYADAVAKCAAGSGYGVPGELSVAVAGLVETALDDAALDDTAQSAKVTAEGGWSGFVIPGRDVGRTAVEDVLGRLDGAAPVFRRVPCPTVQGVTTGAPAAPSPS